MKRKWVKIVLAAAAASLVIGGICIGAGVAMGGSPAFYIDREGIHVKEKASANDRQDYVLKNTSVGALKQLDINLKEADLSIVSGDTWSVEYMLDGARLEPEYSLENGILKIKEGNYRNTSSSYYGFWGWGNSWWGGDDDINHVSPYVKITIPENGKLAAADLENSYGDVRIEKRLNADNTVIRVHDGNVYLYGWEGDTLTLDEKYGDVVTGRLDGNDVSIKNHDGGVQIGELCSVAADFEMQYGDLEAALNGAKSVEVENHDGGVELELIGGIDSYGVSLHTEDGEIRTPQGIVEPDEYEYSSDFISMKGETAGVRVYCNYGDIRIKER